MAAQSSQVVGDLSAGPVLGDSPSWAEVAAQVAVGEAAGRRRNTHSGQKQCLDTRIGETPSGDVLSGGGGDGFGDGGQMGVPNAAIGSKRTVNLKALA